MLIAMYAIHGTGGISVKQPRMGLNITNHKQPFGPAGVKLGCADRSESYLLAVVVYCPSDSFSNNSCNICCNIFLSGS